MRVAGYPKFRGSKLSAADLALCLEGLTLNSFMGQYSHLLTGYMAATHLVQALPPLIKQMRAANPSLVFVCDPVLGDNGALYVPQEFVPLYRSDIIPLATIITPNQTEAEYCPPSSRLYFPSLQTTNYPLTAEC